MTVTDPSATVAIDSEETLADVLDRVRSAAESGRTVELMVPIDSALLLTAKEFRALKDVIDEHRLAVVVRTADPLRLRLGDRLGVRVQALSRPAPASDAMKPASTLPLAADLGRIEAEDEAVQPAPAVDVPRLDLNSNWPLLAEESAIEAETSTAKDDADSTPALVLANPPRRWVPAALLMALIVAGAFFAIRFVVPGSVVRITPRTAPVTASLLFDLTADGQPLDDNAAFALAPTTRTVEVVWEGSAPASGVRVVPDGTATGPIELRNSANEPLTVEADTPVATEDGVEFAFVEAITVPAADAETGEPGAATGSVRAMAAGSGGNVETGAIGGRLPNGIYYSNRMEPTSGGSDKEYAVVAQADLDALSEQARQAARDLAQDALASEEGGEAVFLVTSVDVVQQEDAFDHQVDDETENVSLQSTMTVEATAIDQTEAANRFEVALADLLAARAPNGYSVSVDQIKYSAPEEMVADERGSRYSIEATADARADINEEDRESLASALAGMTDEEAADLLANDPEIAGVTIDYSPAWLPKQMPNNAGRIEIEVAP